MLLSSAGANAGNHCILVNGWGCKNRKCLFCHPRPGSIP